LANPEAPNSRSLNPGPTTAGSGKADPAGAGSGPETRHAWPWAAVATVRVGFGIVWAIDAYLKWQPAFAQNFVGYLQNAANSQPAWLQGWFAFWLVLVKANTGFFLWGTRLLETAIAIGLLAGLARKWVYVVGAIFSLLIWATAEGFGGPYTLGATNLGPGLVYVLVFLALIIVNRLIGWTPYSVDYYIERRRPGWRAVAEWAPARLAQVQPPRLSWSQQALAIGGILLALVLFLGSLQSATSASSATPDNAAAAVSPLQLASNEPGPARDASLPPLLGSGDSVSLTIESSDTNVEIANGVQYQAWTFGGSVPGPIIHVRQGQTVNVTYVNKGMMQHSIDFHAAEIPPDVAYKSINPGQSIQFSFKASTPGVFVYHCGTQPVLLHMANGMYGALIVDPTQGLPKADVSYVLVQGEWYTAQAENNVMRGDYNKMMAASPDEVVFNGKAFQYKDHPLTAKAGQRVRLYVVDAGPTLYSAFHVIGGMFQAVYPDGDPAHALNGVSTYPIAPGQGVVFDLTFGQPGKYPFVDHSMRSMEMGAVGVLQVTP
jgi:nitrite reductase (NO-forming)